MQSKKRLRIVDLGAEMDAMYLYSSEYIINVFAQIIQNYTHDSDGLKSLVRRVRSSDSGTNLNNGIRS